MCGPRITDKTSHRNLINKEAIIHYYQIKLKPPTRSHIRMINKNGINDNTDKVSYKLSQVSLNIINKNALNDTIKTMMALTESKCQKMITKHTPTHGDPAKLTCNGA